MSNQSSDKGRLNHIRNALASGSQSAFGGRGERGAGRGGGLGTSVLTVSTAALLENAQELGGRVCGDGDPRASISSSESSVSAFRWGSFDSAQESSSETSVELGAVGGNENSEVCENKVALGGERVEEDDGGGRQSEGMEGCCGGGGGKLGFSGCFSRRAAVDVYHEGQVQRNGGDVVIDMGVLGDGKNRAGRLVGRSGEDNANSGIGEIGVRELKGDSSSGTCSQGGERGHLELEDGIQDEGSPGCGIQADENPGGCIQAEGDPEGGDHSGGGIQAEENPVDGDHAGRGVQAEGNPEVEHQGEGNQGLEAGDNVRDGALVQVAKPSKSLKLQYNLMYCLGVSTYKTWKEMETKDWFWLVVSLMQKALFWYFAFLSIFHLLCLAKLHFKWFMVLAKYSLFVQFFFYIICTLAKACAIKVFALRTKKTDDMMKAIEEYEANYPGEAESTWLSWTWIITILAINSLLSAVMTAFSGSGSSEWSIKSMTLSSAEYLLDDVLIWSTTNMTETRQDLVARYASDMNATSISLGFIVVMRKFACYLIVGVLLDAMMVIGGVAYQLVMPFMKEVKEVTENVPMENVEECNKLQAKREALWIRRRALKRVMKAINVVYNPLLKMMHVGNLLMYVVFLVIFIFSEDRNRTWVVICMYMYNTIKAEISYYIAGRIAEQNEAVRAWIRNWAMYTGTIHVEGKDIHFNVILDELNKDPIGLGEGNSLIHHTFHFKMLGLSLSVFFSVADDYKVDSDSSDE